MSIVDKNISLPNIMSTVSSNLSLRLLAQCSTNLIEVTSGAEELVAAGDELCVLFDEDLSDRTEVEDFWLVTEELAVNSCPNE